MDSLEERKRQRAKEDEEDRGMFPSKDSVMDILSRTLNPIIASQGIFRLIIDYHEEFPLQTTCSYLIPKTKYTYRSIPGQNYTACYGCGVNAFDKRQFIWMRECISIDLFKQHKIKFKLICVSCEDDGNAETLSKLGIDRRYWIRAEHHSFDMIKLCIVVDNDAILKLPQRIK
jgi:hypothetical protein